jgi:hypothetical protein
MSKIAEQFGVNASTVALLPDLPWKYHWTPKVCATGTTSNSCPATSIVDLCRVRETCQASPSHVPVVTGSERAARGSVKVTVAMRVDEVIERRAPMTGCDPQRTWTFILHSRNSDTRQSGVLI